MKIKKLGAVNTVRAVHGDDKSNSVHLQSGKQDEDSFDDKHENITKSDSNFCLARRDGDNGKHGKDSLASVLMMTLKNTRIK